MPNSFSFAAYYGSNMVLQRGPQRAVVWGYYDSTQGEITMTVENLGSYTGQVKDSEMGGVWSITLPPVISPLPHKITFEDSKKRVIYLENVLFGDVWVCSGQSNMEFTMIQVRIFVVDHICFC